MSKHLETQCEDFVNAHVSEITAALKAGKSPAETCEALSEPYCDLTVVGTKQLFLMFAVTGVVFSANIV